MQGHLVFGFDFGFRGQMLTFFPQYRERQETPKQKHSLLQKKLDTYTKVNMENYGKPDKQIDTFIAR